MNDNPTSVDIDERIAARIADLPASPPQDRPHHIDVDARMAEMPTRSVRWRQRDWELRNGLPIACAPLLDLLESEDTGAVYDAMLGLTAAMLNIEPAELLALNPTTYETDMLLSAWRELRIDAGSAA